MKNVSYIVLLGVFLLHSCGNDDANNESDVIQKEVKIENGIKTVYYKDSDKIRFRGPVNKDTLWQGKVSSYRENGILWSTLTYNNGIENGVAQVFHPNGKLYYSGEYDEGQKSGIWYFYNDKGIFVKEITYEKTYE